MSLRLDCWYFILSRASVSMHRPPSTYVQKRRAWFQFYAQKKCKLTNSKMVRKCFLHLTPDWSTPGGFCSSIRSFVPSVFLSFLEWAIPIFESGTDSPFSSFHLYCVGHLVPMGKGICSASVPLGYPFSKRPGQEKTVDTKQAVC